MTMHNIPGFCLLYFIVPVPLSFLLLRCFLKPALASFTFRFPLLLVPLIVILSCDAPTVVITL